jgi:hypothetical protein
MRRWLVLLLLTAAAVGCGGRDDRAAQTEEGVPAPLQLTTVDGLASVDPDTGRVGFEQIGAVGSFDGQHIARATHRPDGTTRVASLDPFTGQPVSSVAVPGQLGVRVVAADGRVALGPADVDPGPLPAPAPRTETPIAVTDPATGEQRTYRLDGNIEPEAFSTDGRSLFVIRYVPPTAPTEYQVSRLDLETGELGGVYGRDSTDERQEQMGGTARTQVWAPDGSRLYTLYTTYEGSSPTSFIHVLSLDEGWAFCLGLPEPIGWAGEASLAVSPDGRTVYATDTTGVIAAADTESLTVDRTAALTPAEGAVISAAMDGERLFVGSGTEIVVLDPDQLTPTDRWTVNREIMHLRVDDRRDELVAISARQLMTFALDESDPEGVRLRYTDPVPVAGTGTPALQCAC